MQSRINNGNFYFEEFRINNQKKTRNFSQKRQSPIGNLIRNRNFYNEKFQTTNQKETRKLLSEKTKFLSETL